MSEYGAASKSTLRVHKRLEDGDGGMNAALRDKADLHLRTHMRDHKDWIFKSADGETFFFGREGSGLGPAQKGKYRRVLQDWVEDLCKLCTAYEVYSKADLHQKGVLICPRDGPCCVLDLHGDVVDPELKVSSSSSGRN
jgi:hypothetical protein